MVLQLAFRVGVMVKKLKEWKEAKFVDLEGWASFILKPSGLEYGSRFLTWYVQPYPAQLRIFCALYYL
jgi:hypothetical protein